MALIREFSKAENICALVRREEYISVAKSLGAKKVIVGDMRDESAVRAAMEGARAVYHMCPNMSPDELVIGNLVIREAQKAEVQHFVYHSVLHPQTEKMNHHWQKLRVEEMIFESGLPFTILQPAPYMQNLLANWKKVVEEEVLRVPYSVHSRFSFIDLKDLAEAAKIVLTESDHPNAVYELAGTAPMSHMDVAELFVRVLNRDVRAEKQEIRDWRFGAKGLGEYAVENLSRMFEYYDQWGLVGNPNVLKWLLRREATSLGEFIERTLNERNSIH